MRRVLAKNSPRAEVIACVRIGFSSREIQAFGVRRVVASLQSVWSDLDRPPT